MSDSSLQTRRLPKKGTVATMARRIAIGITLRRCREQAGLTRTQAAALAGVSEYTWDRWETAATAIPLERVADICRAIGNIVPDITQQLAA